MRRIKVIVTDFIETDLDWEVEYCKKLGIDFEYYQMKFSSPEELLSTVKDADVLIVNMCKITAQIISGLERCRLIIRHGIGYDNIDIDAATTRQIAVGYVPDYCVNEVAEQTLMLILACQRKLNQQIQITNQSAQSGNWDVSVINPVYLLRGKTVGIIGFGRIGRTVYEILKGFNVQFRIVDPYVSEETQNKYGIKTVTLETALKESDVITIHSSLRWGETYHLLGMPQLKMMKRNAILVNTARGAIVDLEALDLALREGLISMAGIDVYETEPPPPDFPLLNNPRAICTPHLSWLSEESGWNIRNKIMEDLSRFVDGKPPVNQVNEEVVFTLNKNI